MSKWFYGASVLALAAAFPSMARAQSIQQGSINAKLQLVATVTNSSGGAPNFGVHTPGDSRFMYVGEQNGRIRILDFNQPTPLLAANFLDLGAVLGSELIDDTNTGERGLLGAAFHPDFNNVGNPNGFRKFYTFTSEGPVVAPPPPRFTGPPHFTHQSEVFTPNHHSVIREWTVSEPNASGVFMVNTVAPSRVVMQIAKPGQFHNGGSLVFGPDGYLYISTGDGGVRQDGAGGGQTNVGNDPGDGHTNSNNPDTPGGYTGHGNAQDRRNVYGKILRIKPTLEADANSIPNMVGGGWRIPTSNPFTAETNMMAAVPGWQASWVDEIFAYGFRNPFRISFDSLTGNLYGADVGQDRNTTAREEVSHILKGGNHGWVIKSGDQTTGYNYSAPAGVTLVPPIAQYPTTELGHGGLAAIGGFVYRGDDFPAIQGKYVFADLNRQSTVPGGRLLYANIVEPGLNTVFDFNIVGSVPKPAGAFIHGVAEAGDGEIYYLFGNGQIMKLLPEFPVPEPSGVALALLGGVAVCRRGSRRSFARSQTAALAVKP